MAKHLSALSIMQNSGAGTIVKNSDGLTGLKLSEVIATARSF